MVKRLQTPRDDMRAYQLAMNEFSWQWDNEQRKAISVDGIAGPKTYEMMQRLQRERGYHVTATLEGPLLKDLQAHIAKKYLTQDQKFELIQEAKLDPCMIFSVMTTESMGFGYLNNTRAKILFERHWFYKLLKERVSASEFSELERANPDIINRSAGGYLGGEREWVRMDRAMRIHLEAAIMSASWGLGQVMGFNFSVVGAKDVMSFFIGNQTSERHQMEYFLGFFTNQPGLLKAVRERDFERVAYLYNGPGHARNAYVPKLQKAYAAQQVLLKNAGLI